MRKKCGELAQEHQIYILTNSVESVHTDRMQRSLIAPVSKNLLCRSAWAMKTE